MISYDPSDQNQSLYGVLREVIGSKHSEESIRLLSEDFLVHDGLKDVNRAGDENQVTPLFEIRLPKHDKQVASCWQQFTIRNNPEVIQPRDVCKLIDRMGVVVGLQPELIDAISREVAMTRSKTMQKMYHIGQKFTTTAFRKTQKLAPNSENHACFTLVNPKIKPRSEL